MDKSKALVVITGASQGIGKALAIAFAKEGNPLLLISRHMAPLPELNHHKDAVYSAVDVTNYDEMERTIRAAESKYGSVECLINNAGLIKMADLEEVDIETCSYEIDVLLKGPLNGIKIVLPHMAAKKSGTIINITSISDRKPMSKAIAYHAGKYGLRALSECLQLAEAKNHVRVMNIAPAFIKTNIHQKMGMSFKEYSEMLNNPDFLEPEELADIILYCWKLPQKICIRDLVVLPTNSDY
jgi:NADP-dependent 3-hydroxy acid dehydrogenase YdfG